MSLPSIRIAGAGICCLDYIVVAPSVAWGDTAPVHQYCEQGGGLVATALVACARLGAGAELFSLLGADRIGAMIVQELVEEGVGVTHVRRSETGASPFSFVHVNDQSGERTIFHRRATGLAWPNDAALDLSGADVALVDFYYSDLAQAAAAAARAQRIPVVADTTPSAANRDWLRNVDVLIAPHHYVRDGGFGADDTPSTLHAALDAIHSMGPTTAVITLGAKGWVASDGAGRYQGPAFEVPVVDTVGAGDVFHGAYAFALAQRWDTPRCAEFAAAVAALKCTQVGGRTGIPNLEETLNLLRERGGLDWSAITP